MLVNKTVEFFLSEAAGWSGRSAGAGSGLGQGAGDQITGQIADSERPGTGRDTGGGRGRDWDEMPVTKSPGRQRTRSGQEPDEMPAGVEAEQTGSKSTQKKTLYNILQQFWIFQILLSGNDQIAVLQKSRIMVNLNFSSIIFIVFRITFLSKMLPKCYRPVWFQNLKIR